MNDRVHIQEPEWTLQRRGFVAGAAGVLAPTGLARFLGWSHPAEAAEPDALNDLPRARHPVLPPPVPISGGTQIDGVLLHAFAPGPKGVKLPFSGFELQGVNVEPSTITDYKGITTLAHLVGTAIGSDRDSYNLEADIRAFEGEYLAANESRHRGRFALVEVNLYEPGSDAQIHSFNGGILPSGLFWTVEHGRGKFVVGGDGRRAVFVARDLPVIDTFVVLGPNHTPATLDFRVEWEASGSQMQLGSGSSVPEDDPAAFEGRFFPAKATASFSGSEIGFNFRTDREATSELGFAELGSERNGAFLRSG